MSGRCFSARCLARTVLNFERPLTVESLSELRSVLEAAADGWQDVVLDLWESERQESAAQ